MKMRRLYIVLFTVLLASFLNCCGGTNVSDEALPGGTQPGDQSPVVAEAGEVCLVVRRNDYRSCARQQGAVRKTLYPILW